MNIYNATCIAVDFINTACLLLVYLSFKKLCIFSYSLRRKYLYTCEIAQFVQINRPM